MKGILKKVGSVLKLGLSILPYVAVIGGLATVAAGGIVGAKDAGEIKDEFKETQVFIERQAEDIEFVEQDFEDGKISQEKYEELVKDIHSDDYVEKVLDEPENREYRQMLKSSEKKHVLTMINGVTITMAGLIVSGFYLFNDITNDLYSSARKDWNDSNKVEQNSRIELEI